MIFIILEHCTDMVRGGVCGLYFMEPFLFMALDYLMGVFTLGSLTSPRLDDYSCWFGYLFTCAFLVNHPSIAHFMAMEHVISSWCGFDILAYLECTTSC